MSKIQQIEKITYLLLIGGFSLDHITTIIGIHYYSLYETNFIVRNLIDAGLWGITDLFICSILIIVLRKVMDRDNSLQFLLLLPMVSGILRLFVGLSNLFLIL